MPPLPAPNAPPPGIAGIRRSDIASISVVSAASSAATTPKGSLAYPACSPPEEPPRWRSSATARFSSARRILSATSTSAKRRASSSATASRSLSASNRGLMGFVSGRCSNVMLAAVRTAGARSVLRKKSPVAGIVAGKRLSSACSTIARLNSATAGLPCGSVAVSVTWTSLPGRSGDFLSAPVRWICTATFKSRSTWKGLDASWNRFGRAFPPCSSSLPSSSLGLPFAACRTSVITATARLKFGASLAVMGTVSLFSPFCNRTSW